MSKAKLIITYNRMEHDLLDILKKIEDIEEVTSVEISD